MWFPKLSLLLVSFTLCSLLYTPVFAAKKSYIVYLGSHAHGSDVTEADLHQVTDSHHDLLTSYVGSAEKAKEAIIYSYRRNINGFAALLEEEEAAEIAKHPSVVSVFSDKGLNLHTTHSWDFMLLEKDGAILPSSLWSKANFGEDVIIANLDTGVWPESKSFSDEAYGPVPTKWRGKCENITDGVPCNKKLIGAKYFNKGYAAAVEKLNGTLNDTEKTARDSEGHGTHTLSTAGGNFVSVENLFGFVDGVARGGSPKARVAAYKVCFKPVNDSECFTSDILQAFEEAIHDGVDVLTVSLGGDPVDFFDDGVAIGAFHAVKNGIAVVCSAGNSGPKPSSVTNVAPWIITVGASTLDRDFRNYVELQNGKRLKGMSIAPTLPEKKLYPLISAVEIKASNATDQKALMCLPGALDATNEKAKGKIVVCLRGGSPRVDKSRQAQLVGAVGMILCNDQASGDDVISDPHIIPATLLTYHDGLELFEYLNSTKNPVGYITATRETLNTKPAPFMAAFSSRGPNPVVPEIIKPDVTAPGVNILAAYTGAVSPTGSDYDKRRVAFNFESGTSMSCPHVAGIVGLVKKVHPEWSPAAIRSAIMTTARTRDNTAERMRDGANIANGATPFDYGSGHVRPNRAADPGLVYDVTVEDYYDFLCSLGYDETKLKTFTQNSTYRCPEYSSILNFNNPSIAVPELVGTTSVTVTRRVKNVGKLDTYAAIIREPYGISVSVEPSFLKFDKVGEEKSFQVTLTARKRSNQDSGYEVGGLTWTDGYHYVRSPIVVSAFFD